MNFQFGDGTARNARYIPVDVVGLTSGVTQISAGQSITCALTTSGDVKCWGTGLYTYSFTPVDVNGLTSGVTQISASDNHICALTTSGGVKCLGANNYGQLGDGTTANHYSAPVNVVGLTSGVTQIYTNSYNIRFGGYTCALTTTSGVKCWGHMMTARRSTFFNSITPMDFFGLTSGVTLLPEILGRTNQPPTANPGGSYLGAVNTAIQFDGSGSSDPDGDALTYN